VLQAKAVLIAAGGASWPRLGSDGLAAALLAGDGIAVSAFTPSNAGIRIEWSAALQRFAGTPLKRVAVFTGGERRMGEALIARQGLEGGVIYALSAAFRRAFNQGKADLAVDLRPDLTVAALAMRLSQRRKGESLATLLKRAAKLPPAAVALLREAGSPQNDPASLAAAIKAVPLRACGFNGLDRAISSAGGVPFSAVDEWLMVKHRPGLFLAGEILDWDAPTGGYLLQGCFSSAARAAEGIRRYLATGERP
jgi:uncharacterized flavoprotein (TIGR03862 family)